MSDTCPKCHTRFRKLLGGDVQDINPPDIHLSGSASCLRRQLGQAVQALADICVRLKGHPDSALDGEGGLAAATMADNERLRRERDDLLDFKNEELDPVLSLRPKATKRYAAREPAQGDGEGEESSHNHPEAHCQRCGRQNVTWYTDNELWNSVVDGSSGIYCPVCFVQLAEQKGIRPTAWRLTRETREQPHE